jgi:hypothetical protein
MGRTSRALRMLPPILAVWCLGCDAFEAIVESLLDCPERATITAAVADASTTSTVSATTEAGDTCHCVLGHAATVSVALALNLPAHVPGHFVERPSAVILPAPEPLLRPPVA